MIELFAHLNRPCIAAISTTPDLRKGDLTNPCAGPNVENPVDLLLL